MNAMNPATTQNDAVVAVFDTTTTSRDHHLT